MVRDADPPGSSPLSDRKLDLFPGGVLLGILGGGVPPGSSNPDLISDLNMLFSTPVFRPGVRFSKVPVTYRAR